MLFRVFLLSFGWCQSVESVELGGREYWKLRALSLSLSWLPPPAPTEVGKLLDVGSSDGSPFYSCLSTCTWSRATSFSFFLLFLFFSFFRPPLAHFLYVATSSFCLKKNTPFPIWFFFALSLSLYVCVLDWSWIFCCCSFHRPTTASRTMSIHWLEMRRPHVFLAAIFDGTQTEPRSASFLYIYVSLLCLHLFVFTGRDVKRQRHGIESIASRLDEEKW